MPEKPEESERRTGVSISMQDYVEALIEPVGDRMRKGDVTLREYLEHVIEEHRQQVLTMLEAADRLMLERLRTLERVLDERWDRGEEQIRITTAAAEQAVEQLRRERELVTRAQSEAIEKAQDATALAIQKAEMATDKRFEAVNEFRAQQGDIINRFVPREVADAKFTDLQRAIDELRDKLSKIA